MIKTKSKKLLFALLGVATFTLPIVAASCSLTARPDSTDDASTIAAPRENFTPSMTTVSRNVPDPQNGADAMRNVNVRVFRNFVVPALFVEYNTLISDNGVNESFYEGTQAAAATYNEFFRVNRPATNSLEYSPRTTNKTPTHYTPVEGFLDNYESGYTIRANGVGGANVLITVGAKHSTAIKAWLWEAKNVDIPILNDRIVFETEEKAKIVRTGKTPEQIAALEKPFDDRIKGFRDQIDKINNTVIVAYGYDPSTTEDILVFKYRKDPGQRIGFKDNVNVDRVKETYAIPEGQSIQIVPGTLTARPLNNFIANSIYNILLDLDTTDTANWSILNKGGTAKNETFILGAKSIKIMS